MVVTYPFGTPAGWDVEPEGLRLLAEGPVASARMNGVDVGLVLGYHVVRQVLSDSWFSRARAARPDGPVTNPAGANPEFLVSMDPPAHTRIRRLMAEAFGPRMVDRLEPWMRRLVAGLLDELDAHGSPADLVRLLAEPLPIMVICELLGVPIDDRVVTLFQHPEQAALLADRPDLRPRAVDELLRYSRLRAVRALRALPVTW